MTRERSIRSPLVLWVVAPLLLALSWYRPFTASRGLAEQLPTQIAGFRMDTQHEMTARQFELLGTGDAVWRTYIDAQKNEIFVVALFHRRNWKSVHPPRICLEGSDMTILEEGQRPLDPSAGTAVGRIVANSGGAGGDYVSLFAYGAPGFLGSGYTQFFLHHAPRAIVRRSTGGFLLRVESWVGSEDGSVADARCLEFMRAILPECQALVER